MAIFTVIWRIAKGAIAWFLKNVALIIGIIEAAAKVVTGIVSLTPTKSDDWLSDKVDWIASWLKRQLYNASDWLMDKNF